MGTVAWRPAAEDLEAWCRQLLAQPTLLQQSAGARIGRRSEKRGRGPTQHGGRDTEADGLQRGRGPGDEVLERVTLAGADRIDVFSAPQLHQLESLGSLDELLYLARLVVSHAGDCPADPGGGPGPGHVLGLRRS